MLIGMSEEEYETLFRYEEDGVVDYDLFEVLWLEGEYDPIRVEKLEAILEHKDKYFAYMATQVLIAWGYESGLNKLGQILTERWDKIELFEPHRIWSVEMMYDRLAYALRMSRDKFNDELIMYYTRRLLGLFSEIYYDIYFRVLLLSLKYLDELADELEKTMCDAMEDDSLQASLIFVVLTKVDSSYYDKYVDAFKELQTIKDSRIKFSLADAQKILSKEVL